MANWVISWRRIPIWQRNPSQPGQNTPSINLGDRERIAYFTGKPVHYLDGGLWKPIDTKLLAASGGFYGAPHSDVRIHTDGRVQVDGTNYQQYTDLPGAPSGSLDNDRIVREFSFGSQILTMVEDGFRQEIILNRIPTPTEVNQLIASVQDPCPLIIFKTIYRQGFYPLQYPHYYNSISIKNLDAVSSFSCHYRSRFLSCRISVLLQYLGFSVFILICKKRL